MKVVVRRFEGGDATAVSALVTRNLLEINSRDYALEKMRELADGFTPDKLSAGAENRTMFVALNQNEPVGTASLADFGTDGRPDYFMSVVFVLPELHGQGTGSRLVREVERAAIGQGARRLSVLSSLTAEKFYLKLGYVYMSGCRTVEPDGHIVMEKRLGSAIQDP